MPTDFPPTLQVRTIDARHPDWNCNYQHWERLRKLYEGAKTMQVFCTEFLWKRAVEALDVYNERVQRFSYTNHLKSIISWYTSALFKQPPDIQIRKLDEAGNPTLIEAGPEKDKLADFLNDADGKGTDFITWWSSCVQAKLLVYGTQYVLFDLPVSPQFRSAAQQNSANALQPHLVAYAPQDIINWQFDEQGALNWIIIKLRARTQNSPLDKVQLSDRWYWFTTDEIAVYEYTFQQGETGTVIEEGDKRYPDNAIATLVDGYPRAHALSDQGRVPVFVEQLEQNIRIGDDIVSPLIRLVNLENSHDWALEQSNLAVPVVFSDAAPESLRISESTFLQLKPGDKIQFLEQSGHAFQASGGRIGETREEVYRLAHLIQQGRSSNATAAAQSGIAKEADLTPARDVLSALGDLARRSIKRVVQCACDRMQIDVQVDVQGLDFPDRSESIELENLQRAMATFDIGASPTLERALSKRVARIMVPDATPELLTQIDTEFDNNPTPSEAEQQQQQQQSDQRLRQLAQAINNKSLFDAANAD